MGRQFVLGGPVWMRNQLRLIWDGQDDFGHDIVPYSPISQHIKRPASFPTTSLGDPAISPQHTALIRPKGVFEVGQFLYTAQLGK